MPESPDAVRRGWDRVYANSSPVPDEPDGDVTTTVAALRELAAPGPVLELAVGHGRIAIPLAASGLEVHGIDYSAKAIELLKAHPDGVAVQASVADMSDFALDRTYSLAYLVFNTIQNLTTQDQQVACFQRTAAHLKPDGRFVIENSIPDLRRLAPGTTAVPFTVTDDYLGIDEYSDLMTHQQYRSRHFYRSKDHTFTEFAVPFRFVWPSELDLMARLAGMTLEHRWADWDRTPFTDNSPSAVSVWRKSPTPT